MASNRARLNYLDGLRGWAALSVVVFHASWETFGIALPGLRTTVVGPFNDGHFAVAVFFALSGFVLSRQFIRTGDRAKLQQMAAGRYVRLAVPIGLISVIGYVMMITGLLHNGAAGDIVASDWVTAPFSAQPTSVLSLLKFSVYKVFTTLEASRGYNPFTWTMVYELCGSYLLFASLALFGDTKVLRRSVLVLGLCVSYFSDPLYSLFFGGALLAEIHVAAGAKLGRGWRDAIGFALVGIVWFSCIVARDVFRVETAMILLAATLLSPGLQLLLTTRVSLWLGQISFPLYLVHAYVLFGPGAWSIVYLDGAGLPMPTIAAIVVPGVIVGSMVAGWLLLPVERLSIRASHFVGQRVMSMATRSTK